MGAAGQGRAARGLAARRGHCGEQVPLSAMADFPKLLAMRLPPSPRVWWAPP